MSERNASEADPLDPLREPVRQLVASMTGVSADEIDLDRTLLELGFDSLEALELGHRLDETFGAVPEPSELLSATLADLCDSLARALPPRRPPTRAGTE